MLTVHPSSQLANTSLLLANESLVREAAMVMKNPIYPFGRCSRVVPVQGVRVNNIYIYPEGNRTLEVYLRDPVNRHGKITTDIIVKNRITAPIVLHSTFYQ